MMETQTRGKRTIDCGLREPVGTLDDVNPTRLSKRSQAVPLQLQYVKINTLGRLCDNDLERSYIHFTMTNVYFIRAVYNSTFTYNLYL